MMMDKPDAIVFLEIAINQLEKAERVGGGGLLSDNPIGYVAQLDKQTYEVLLAGLKREVTNLKDKPAWRSSWGRGKHKLTWRVALDTIVEYYADGGTPMDIEETTLFLSERHNVDERTARKAMDLYRESLPGILHLWGMKPE